MIILNKIYKHKKRNSTDLFFIEMIIVILFFSISFAVILNVFSKAGVMSSQSQLNENINLCAQSIAEEYSVIGDADNTLKSIFGNDLTDYSEKDGFYTVILDDKCKPCNSEIGISLILTETYTENENGRLSILNVAFTKNEQIIYSFECSAYKIIQ